MSPKVSLPKVGEDKALHAGLSTIAVVAAAPVVGIGYAVLIVALLGLAKELVWDWAFGLGTPDVLDFVADLFGVGLGALLLIAAKRTHVAHISVPVIADSEE